MEKKDYLQSLVSKIGQRSIVPWQRSLARDEIRSVIIKESGEDMVPIPHSDKVILLENSLAQKYPITRERIAQKILEVADVLPEKLILGIQETFRPREVQIHYRERKFEQLAELYPEKSEEEIWQIVDTYISRPGGPHQTGGAIDLTLVWKETGEPLDMGTEFGLPDGASYTNSEKVSWEAQAHRYLLWSYMTSVGFRNYPSEWWHYEYGTARWTKYLGLEHAFYSAID